MTDAERIREWLAAAGISQRQLARDLELNERTVRRYCAGDIPIPRVVWLALDQISAQRSK